MTESASAPGAITPQQFRDVIGRFATGVTVITTSDERQRYGTTASAVSSLSLEPPMLLICMNRESSTGQAIARVGRFVVNILAEDQDHLAVRFARKDPDKFDGITLTPGQHGEPLLEGALAHLECRVTEQVLGGTHTVYIGEVDRASGQAGTPLAYFRGQFGRLQIQQDEHAHAALRSAIIDRSIAIGEPLHLEAVAQRLGVSDRSVQQGLVRLCDEGLVSQQDDGSFLVVPLTFETIEDAFRARTSLQLGAAVMTVGGLNAEQLTSLRREMEKTLPVRGDGTRMSPDEWFEANAAFHEHMLRAAGSQVLIAAHRRLTVPGLMTRALGPDDELGDDVATDHVRIVEAYEAGDLTAACEAIRSDNERGIDLHRERMRRAGGLV
ncbi:MAG: flavin reductase [Solirubrobacterales bacterium]|nr:flavin reductase [Solirubrobacterales bacterium]